MSKGYLYSILSVLLMALAGPMQKKSMEGLTPLHVLFFSNFAAFIASAVAIFRTRAQFMFKLNKKALFLAFLYLTAQVSFSFAINKENPVIVNSISRSYLVFNFMISFFILKESFSLRQIGAALLILAGTFGLSIIPNDDLKWSLAASLTIFYSFLFSIHNSLLKFSQNQNAYQLILLQNGLCCFVFSASLIYQPLNFKENSVTILYSCLVGFFSSFLGFVLYKKGLHYLRFSEASSVRSLSPIIGFAAIYPFYPIELTLFQKVALLLLLIGCLGFNLKRKPDEPT